MKQTARFRKEEDVSFLNLVDDDLLKLFNKTFWEKMSDWSEMINGVHPHSLWSIRPLQPIKSKKKGDK
jgi:hypothetical protein